MSTQTVGPLSDSQNPFPWHIGTKTGGSIFNDYDILSVIAVNATLYGNQMRTAILKVRHKTLDREYAMKIMARWDDADKEDIAREQQLHYLLTQCNSNAFVAATNKPATTRGLFESTPNDAQSNDAQLSHTMVKNGFVRNIAPLYDFSDVASWKIPVVQDTDKFGTLIRPDNVSVSIMKLVEGTLDKLIQDSPPLDAIKFINAAIIQICCNLHQLLSIRFAHGDIKPNNIGFVKLDHPYHYKITPNYVYQFDAAIPHFVILDFGFSRAEMKDARGQEFRMVPSTNSITKRFNNYAYITPDQTLSPMIDVFGMIQKFVQLASRKLYAVTITDQISHQRDRLEFAFKASFAKLPPAFKLAHPHQRYFEFFRQKTNSISTTILDDESNSIWSLYTYVPTNLTDIMACTLPFDVLSVYAHGKNLPSNSVDMTMHPLYDKGKFYRYTGDGNDIRTHPIDSIKM